MSERETRLDSAVGPVLKLTFTECNVKSAYCRGRREAVALSEREIRLDSAVGPALKLKLTECNVRSKS